MGEIRASQSDMGLSSSVGVGVRRGGLDEEGEENEKSSNMVMVTLFQTIQGRMSNSWRECKF
jgi:hypothetical protein